MTLISCIYWPYLLLNYYNRLVIHFKISYLVWFGWHCWRIRRLQCFIFSIIEFNFLIHLFLNLITISTIFIFMSCILNLRIVLSLLNVIFLLYYFFLLDQLIIVFSYFHFFSGINCFFFLFLIAILNNWITPQNFIVQILNIRII
jgi:hypothetical protein